MLFLGGIPLRDIVATIDEYLATLRGRGYRPRGIARYRDQLLAFVRFLDSSSGLASWTEENILRYRDALAARCAGGTVGNALTAIRSFCRWAVRRKIMNEDPTLDIEWPRRTKAAPRALSRDELRQLWDLLQTPARLRTSFSRMIWQRNRVAVCLMLYAGLRVAEAAALRWRDIDLETGVLIVRCGKGGKDRCVPIHPRLSSELAAMPRRSSAYAVLCRPGGSGEPIGPKSLAHIFERWLRRLGLRISAHRLRHSFATEMLRSGADLRCIQELLGHERLETTQRYLMVDAERMRAAVNVLPMAW